MKKKTLNTIIAFAVVAVALVAGFLFPSKDGIKGVPLDTMEINYLDVGQGDCSVIILPGGKVMMIDCGEAKYGEEIGEFLKSKNIDTIDFLVATHPHADHIGSMEYIINNFDIGSFYMPDCDYDTETFFNMLTALNNKDVQSNLAKAGDIIYEDESTICKVLSPKRNNYKEVNDYSVVVKIICGEKSFLFMGDAEETAESEITGDVSADVLKVGHHGSSTSTKESFLKKVDPDIAVISCGKNNKYGHPDREVTNLLKKYGVETKRTDVDGTFTLRCDGKNIEY